MVEDRITDGRRIAQLLASELTGLERGPLSDVTVVDADRDVDPDDDGAFAYAVEFEGRRIGHVEVTPTTARVALPTVSGMAVDREDVTVEAGAEGTVVVVHSGAAVKTVVDVLVGVLSD